MTIFKEEIRIMVVFSNLFLNIKIYTLLKF